MSLMITAGSFGLVLDSNRRGGTARKLSERDEDEPLGHFTLNRYRVDDGGHVCLTPSLPLAELVGSIDIFKAELDGLLIKAKERKSEAEQPLPDPFSASDVKATERL